MKKRSLQIFTGVCLVIIVFGCGSKEVNPMKPNVLFILADDLGYYDLNCMGSAFYETPNIDRIGNEGIVFTNGYANCQVCSPSRASIMSSKFPARHGITDWIGARTGEKWRELGRYNKLLPAEYVHNLSSEYITLPEAMKQAGYKTFFAGKWHLGKEGSWPSDHGFDINIGGWQSGSPRGGYFSPWENPNLENLENGENLSMRLAGETVKFISEHKDTSFFAFLSFYAVHGPIQTTQEKWAKYRQKAEAAGILKTGFEMENYLPIRKVQDNPVYGGLVESMDDAVGKVLACLDELGLNDNTIVIFTSDNGGVAAGDAFATSNLPFRGGKGQAYEGGIREPYFIKVPWQKGLKRCDVPVTGSDFYPTILDLIGEDLLPEEHSDGVSLVPLLSGGSIGERSLIWHYPHYGNQGGDPSSIIRKGPWKLIHFYEDGRQELYNLLDDPEEEHEISGQQPELVSKLMKELFEFLNDNNARYPRKDPTYVLENEQTYLKEIEENLLPHLERQRMIFLSKDFDPGNEWWGSTK